MKIHEKYIKRCLQLAENGLGRTYPNPMVGAVVVHKDRIIGEGWHRKAGEAHAEVHAINSVKDKRLLGKSTIYVSLEPCSHYGKTPPCSDLIIASGIRKVVIGSVDPFAAVAGRGIKKLMDAGCMVSVGILEKECRELNRRFFTFHQQQRPYIILKWAESRDGFISPKPSEASERKPVWITNQYSRQLVHKWRAEEQAILVGTNTAVSDDPGLGTRSWHGPDPVRLVLDRQLRIPKESQLFDRKIRTIVITDLKNTVAGNEENLTYEKIDFDKDPATQVAGILYKHELQSVIIEGGRQTLQTFIDSGLWDEARNFRGNEDMGAGTQAPKISGRLVSETRLEADTLKIYRNDHDHNI